MENDAVLPPCTGVRGARLLHLRTVFGAPGENKPGWLAPLDFAELPFPPARQFVVSVDGGGTRGCHAHRESRQLLQCVAGHISVDLDDGTRKATVELVPGGPALLLDALVWSVQNYEGPHAVLLALCSDRFNENGYVRDYDEFLDLVKQNFASSCRIKVPFLDLKAAALASEPGLSESFQRVLHSGRYVLGPEVTSFESSWAEFCGAKHCIGVGSGLAALQLLLLASDIGPGDEVIVASNSYIATVLAVSHAGATPVLVEPCAETRLIDPQKIEAAITPRTKAILSTDLYGQTVNYDAIARISRKHGIKFFSDAAQAHGAVFGGQTVGSGALCDGTAFSFYPSKNLGALGEGGCVTTDDPLLADRIRMLRNYGSRVRYENEERGYNERMDPLQAALLQAKLPKLKEFNSRRAEIAERYLAAFKELDWLELPLPQPGTKPAWHLFVVSTRHRGELQSHLASLGIETMIHYPTPPHLSQAYSDLGYSRGSFPIAEELADTVLSLPICPMMSDQMVRAVVDGVRSFK